MRGVRGGRRGGFWGQGPDRCGSRDPEADSAGIAAVAPKGASRWDRLVTWFKHHHHQHSPHSLRGKLTAVNVILLALGIAAATAVSLMGMQHYLMDRVDTELIGNREALEGTGFTQKEIDSLRAMGTLLEQFAPGDRRSSLPRSDTLIVALDSEGQPTALAGIEPSARQRTIAAAVDNPAGLSRSGEVRSITIDGEPYRICAAQLGDDTTVLMATSTGAIQNAMRRALKLDIVFGAVLLVLLALLTMGWARRRLRPLEDMVQTASAIAEGDLTRRVPMDSHTATEIEQLRIALNAMLHQVESAFETRERSAAQLRRFVADASHELRTPLSAIRGYLQLYDRGMLRKPAERSRALARMNAEADRMGRLVEELLTLARLDRQAPLRMSAVEVGQLVRDAVDDLRAQQSGRPIVIRADGPMTVRGDESGLRQIVGNLLGNVRAHTPAEAQVTLELVHEEGDGPGPGRVRLMVADAGPGMTAQDADRIFDRFFRAAAGGQSATREPYELPAAGLRGAPDERLTAEPGPVDGSRKAATDGRGVPEEQQEVAQPPGSGLGMAIVQAVVAAHSGEVSVRTAPGEGLAVTVVLPAARETPLPPPVSSPT
ncbi:sensor histidine kinase [Streptomyces albipurpureus]|uniref:histidine kinase n=1 Tax=Streptomyces albipurpureus TaxID=2897419 RepID=A0ABT0UPS1_9ACTN|nr:HAMP domain-containing sensor histidine kinase [Streptomyces sp. CWNU-1]MCM2389348.1 HAMP domain-containing histidine kinase [Streptomyces sp. CWNU-1]